jgi:hypothetical protein
MKPSTILICLAFLSLTVNAQNDKFTNAMLNGFEKAKQAKSLSEMQDLANYFERIAKAEKTQWTAWYYCAFYNLVVNFTDSVPDHKRKFTALAQSQIEEGLKVKPGESELLVLIIMSYFAEMAVDPMKGMELIGKVNESFDLAKSLNPSNPRIYLEQSEMIMNMPVEYGGGSEKALPILLIAKEKFDNFVLTDTLAPNWGKERSELLLAKCRDAQK